MNSFKFFILTFILPWTFAQAKSISVGGFAIKTLEPNIILVNFEVWAKGANAKQAQQSSANEYQRVKKVFDTFKVEKKDIQTENYSLAPEYVYDQKTQQNKMTGFRVGQSLAVTLRKVDDVGAFLDAVVTSAKVTDQGVTVNSIGWDSDKRAQAEIAGLAEAVQDARRKADEIAKAAGVKIKNVENISHNVSAPGPMPGNRTFMKAVSMDVSGGAAPTELSAGQVRVRVDVQATYEL